MKKIFSNRVTALIVIVLCILPSLYAWFYLKSSWDPYGHTKGLKVAVVNNDVGAIFRDRFVNIWADVVEELKENEDIGWVFVDQHIAEEGTRLGKYYANIVIEAWFSEKMTTLLELVPQHPEIRYTVNEKLNAIAPKITWKGASTIKDNIQKSFIDTVNHVLMEQLNLMGFDLKKERGKIQDFVNFVQDAHSSLGNWDKKLDRVITSTQHAKSELENFNSKIPWFYEAIAQGKSMLRDTASLSDSTLHTLDTVPPKLRENFEEMRTTAEDIDRELLRFLERADTKSQEFSTDIVALTSKISTLETKIWLEIQFLDALKVVISDFLPDASILKPIKGILDKLTIFRSKLLYVRSSLSALNSGIHEGISFWKDTRDTLKSVAQDLRGTFDEIRSDFDREISPQLRSVLEQVRTLSSKGVERLDDAEKRLPELQREVYSGVDLIDSGLKRLYDFRQDLPKLQANIGKLDDKLQELKRKGVLDEFIKIATLDPERFSDFIADPVELVENKLFSIPNYGSAMSPFFTTLAIWVGSLLMISIFSTRSREKKFYSCKNYQKFLGKYLFFLTIALVQGLIVSLGDMWILDAYVANPGAFVGTALRSAVVFSMVVYSTVATFWIPGKAMVILFLVLQLSGAGGTFPIQLSGAFFQAINPFLPFTYSISAMREAVGGVVPEVFYPHLCILLWFFGLFLLFGLFLKPRIAVWIARFEHKFSQSELGEH